jgi:hypothetical protein
MAEADWDEVTYLRKKPQRAADAKSQKVSAEAQIPLKAHHIKRPPCSHTGCESSTEEGRGSRNVKEM